MAAKRTVGVIGLGIMGGAISRNLAKRGFAVRGYDVDPAAAGQLREDGGMPRRFGRRGGFGRGRRC